MEAILAFDVTLLVLSYNQESSIEKAVRAAFVQTGDPIEIVLSDDKSSDATFKIMADLAAKYDGPHEVRVRQSIVNQGLIRHIESAVTECQGNLVILAAGDDFSHPQRADRLRGAWRAAGSKPAYLYSDVQPVSVTGARTSFGNESVYAGPHSLKSMARGQIATLGASSAITRDLIERFPRVVHFVRHEDRVYPFRASLLGGDVIFIDDKLIDYTITGGVSRDLPLSKSDFLTRWTRNLNLKTVQDAHQRLDDARHAAASRHTLKACRRTIRAQEALIRLTESDASMKELSLVASMFRGGFTMKLLWHYAKFRLPVGRSSFQ